MTYIAGVVGAALLFGLFAMLRPRDADAGCTGHCVGCTRDGSCRSQDVREPHDNLRTGE
jgi:hypothetical protein